MTQKKITRILRRVATILVLLGGFAGVSGAGGLVFIFWYYGQDIQSLDEHALRNYRPPQVTRVYARDGTLIGELFEQRRTVRPIEEIPTLIKQAFLAAEDADFYHHQGMDYAGMVRALIANVRAGKIRQGASTITQQVVKNFVLTPERSFARKVQELILARRLEIALTKDEILELYLNEIYFGHGRYGVEEAALFFFGKHIEEISVGQAAMLAGIPKAPNGNSPFNHPERAKSRQVYVLDQMLKHFEKMSKTFDSLGEPTYAKKSDIDRFISMDLEILEGPIGIPIDSSAEEFVDFARKTIIERYGESGLRTLGAKVTMTVDLELQKATRDGVSKGLLELDRRRQFGRASKVQPTHRQKRALKPFKKPIRNRRVYPAVVQSCPGSLVLDAPGFCGQMGEHQVFVKFDPNGRYADPEMSFEQQFVVGGIVKIRVLGGRDETTESLPKEWLVAELAPGPESGVLLADVESGEVMAMVGGSKYRRADFNRTTDAKRQPGSAFKPMIYGAAINSRQVTAASLISDSPEVYEKWRPTNFESDVYRGDIRLRTAMTHSVNTIAIKLLDMLGPAVVVQFARAAGITSPLHEHLSLALGTSEVTMLEMLRAYMTIARRGEKIDPTFVLSIEAPSIDRWEPERPSEQVLAEEVVFILTSMMQSVVESGTGRRARQLGRPVAGKTGTSADNRDAWFAGFTRKHVAVAWVGFDTPRKLGSKETGGKAALPIWLSAMAAAEQNETIASFDPPASVMIRTIDKQTGLLVAPGSVPTVPDSGNGDSSEEGDKDISPVMEEYFLEGTEPVEFVSSDSTKSNDLFLEMFNHSQSPLPN